MYTVYKHTTPSGKVYIGITKQVPKYRWHNGKGYNSQVFWRAIQKYGWDNIHHEIIAYDLTQEEACNLEIQLIAVYKSNNPKFGYNCSMGGEKSALGYKHSEKSKKQISDALKRVPHKRGYHLTAEHKKKVSNALKGRPHSEEHNKHVSEANKGRQVTPETRKNLSKSHLGHTHTEEQKRKMSESAKRYWNTVPKEQRQKYAQRAKLKRKDLVGVDVYDENDTFVQHFSVSADCARYLGVSPALICKKLKQDISFVRGYKLKKSVRVDNGIISCHTNIT